MTGRRQLSDELCGYPGVGLAPLESRCPVRRQHHMDTPNPQRQDEEPATPAPLHLPQG
jgi:hypothetical protein